MHCRYEAVWQQCQLHPRAVRPQHSWHGPCVALLFSRLAGPRRQALVQHSQISRGLLQPRQPLESAAAVMHDAPCTVHETAFELERHILGECVEIFCGQAGAGGNASEQCACIFHRRISQRRQSQIQRWKRHSCQRWPRMACHTLRRRVRGREVSTVWRGWGMSSANRTPHLLQLKWS